MRLAILIAFVGSLAFTAAAADPGQKPEELIGEWVVTGRNLSADGKYSLIFADEGKLTMKISAGASANSVAGPKWSYTEGRLSLEGTGKIGDLKMSGIWVTDWISADEILITVARGTQYTLKRVGAKKE